MQVKHHQHNCFLLHIATNRHNTNYNPIIVLYKKFF